MNATLYNTSSSYNTVSKDLSNTIGDTTLTLYNKTDLLNPTFKCRNKTNANYMHVDGMGYYFIHNQITDSGCCYYICELDVLMSYNLSELPVTVTRNEFDYNEMLADNILPLSQDKILYTRNFSPNISVFTNTQEYILAIIEEETNNE